MKKLLITSALIFTAVVLNQGVSATEEHKGTSTVGALDNTATKELDKAGKELDKAGESLEEDMKKNAHKEEKGIGSDSKAK